MIFFVTFRPSNCNSTGRFTSGIGKRRGDGLEGAAISSCGRGCIRTVRGGGYAIDGDLD